MKCSRCDCEVNWPDSNGYCKECETFLINDQLEKLKSMDTEEKLDWLACLTAEMISRNMMDEV
jgi:hypothetical protein